MRAKEGLTLGRSKDKVSGLFLFIPLLALMLFSPGSTYAVEATLTGDAYISSSQPTKNFGTQAVISVQGTPQKPGGKNGFLKFNLSNLPSGTTGADVNAANPDGNTPLMGPALGRNKELVEFLHQKGAKPDAKNQNGLTALVFARQKGNNEVVAFLRGVSEPEAGEVMRDPTTGMEFIYVKGGCFQMGDNFGDGDSSDKPVHEVCVDGFYIGKYEVTQCQWERVMGSNPSNFKNGENYPVEQVSWNDAQNFIRRLNQSSGQKYRLPTEAEWEYAARSGGKNERWAGTSDQNQLAEFAWFRENSRNETHPVGQKRATLVGLHDMSGNVWEWCQDWYDGGYYTKSPKDNPKGPDSGQNRVLRGGSWIGIAWFQRASKRSWREPTDRYYLIGFRLVLPYHQETDTPGKQ